MLDGGVLVREGGQWRLHASDPAPVATPSAGFASNQRTLISKPGATSAQAQRAAAQFLNSSAKVTAYNNAMQSCLRSVGCTIHSPAA